jgi:hypothetical protein
MSLIETNAVEHVAFVLSIVPTETTLGDRVLRSLCIDAIRRFARRRLVELCIGLQPLDLPAFVVCRIAKNSEVCAYRRMQLAELWTVVTHIKHRHPRNYDE